MLLWSTQGGSVDSMEDPIPSPTSRTSSSRKESPGRENMEYAMLSATSAPLAFDASRQRSLASSHQIRPRKISANSHLVVLDGLL